MSLRLAPLLSLQQIRLRLPLVLLIGVASLAACGGGGGSAGSTPVVPAPGVDGPAWFGFGRDAQ
ncbi:MAG: hypothetical protein ABI520_14310, partial [Caldimonas sp.]